jgi:hypothetical protein
MVKVAAIAVIAAETLVAGQGKDAARVLSEVRKALGGEKLAAVKTLSAEGRSLRTGPDGNTRESEFELSMDLPDRYLMRMAMVAMGNMSIYRMSGFNGGQPIDEIDRPPNLAGGNVVIRFAGPGGSSIDPEKATPEQKAELDRMRLLQNKREFARLTLGMFATSLSSFPLEFTYAGEAESADGKADVLDIKGDGDFKARLFVDQQTHLPLMISWMDKEPVSITMGPRGTVPAGAGGPVAVGGGGTVVQRFDGAGGAPSSPEEREKLLKELEAKRKEAEANRRTVEYRLYYADYQSTGGVKLPHKFQRSIDGKTTEEMIFDTLKVNPKIDAKRFQVSK